MHISLINICSQRLKFFQQSLIQILYLELSLCLSSLVLLRNILPLVVKLFAPRQADLYLDQTVFEVDLQRNQRIPFLLDLVLKLADLIIMKQQFADPQGILVENIPLLIGG